MKIPYLKHTDTDFEPVNHSNAEKCFICDDAFGKHGTINHDSPYEAMLVTSEGILYHLAKHYRGRYSHIQTLKLHYFGGS